LFSTSCSFCDSFEESENHLFASCLLVWEVWLKVFRWFGVVTVLPHSMVSIFETFRTMRRIRKEGRKKRYSYGLACGCLDFVAYEE
jgi:hypothetical protein